MNTDGTGFHTCKECHNTESLWNHTTTDHKEGEQLEDWRSVGASSCNSGDGTDQRVQSLMFMMMISFLIESGDVAYLLLYRMASCLFHLIIEHYRPAVLYSWSAFIFGYKHFSVKVNDSLYWHRLLHNEQQRRHIPTVRISGAIECARANVATSDVSLAVARQVCGACGAVTSDRECL